MSVSGAPRSFGTLPGASGDPEVTRRERQFPRHALRRSEATSAAVPGRSLPTQASIRLHAMKREAYWPIPRPEDRVDDHGRRREQKSGEARRQHDGEESQPGNESAEDGHPGQGLGDRELHGQQLCDRDYDAIRASK